ncbi:MAG: type II toxin-antitoxin system PemK/MazF family toxin [candidate division KSB1 bacterium]
MTRYDFGTVLLLKFPHTDMQGSAKRPALVVHDEGDEDVVVARITSQSYAGKNDYEITDWRQVGLVFPSWIRLGKLATLEKKTIERVIGRLLQSDAEKAKAILRNLFAE